MVKILICLLLIIGGGTQFVNLALSFLVVPGELRSASVGTLAFAQNSIH